MFDLSHRVVELLETRAVMTSPEAAVEAALNGLFNDNLTDVTAAVAAMNTQAGFAASQLNTITNGLPSNASQSVTQLVTSAVSGFTNTFGNTLANWVNLGGTFAGQTFDVTVTTLPGWFPGMTNLGGTGGGASFGNGYWYYNVDTVFSFTPVGSTTPGTLALKYSGSSNGTTLAEYNFTQPLSPTGTALSFRGKNDVTNNRGDFSFAITTPEMVFSANAMREGSTVTSRSASVSLQTTNGLRIAASDSYNAVSGASRSASVSRTVTVGDGDFDLTAKALTNPTGSVTMVGGSYRNGSQSFDFIGINTNPANGPAFSGVTSRWNLETSVWGFNTLGSTGVTVDSTGALKIEIEASVSPSTALPGTFWKVLELRAAATSPVANEEAILNFIIEF